MLFGVTVNVASINQVEANDCSSRKNEGLGIEMKWCLPLPHFAHLLVLVLSKELSYMRDLKCLFISFSFFLIVGTKALIRMR